MTGDYFFFFFQAEDGIRDWSVTGVQTCALPILGTVDKVDSHAVRFVIQDYFYGGGLGSRSDDRCGVVVL